MAAVIALVALRVAARPADHNHHFGHGKAEYFSAGAEGLMIFVAAAVILASAFQRFLHPAALDSVGLGLVITTVASVVNGAVGLLLLRAGRAHRSVTLTADGKHLLTDVWTSVGVIIGVLLVVLTGWQRLDPVVAALVGLNILITGYRLVSQSVTSLLDAALTDGDLARLAFTLDSLRTADADFTQVRTRESGRHRFVSLTVMVPAGWTIERGHQLTETIESAITRALPGTDVATHLAPRMDHRSRGHATESAGSVAVPPALPRYPGNAEEPSPDPDASGSNATTGSSLAAARPTSCLIDLRAAYPDQRQRLHATTWLSWIAYHMGTSRDLAWWTIPRWSSCELGNNLKHDDGEKPDP